jgi:hypothetical protein
MTPWHADIRKALLALVILAPTAVLAVSFPASQSEVPNVSSNSACCADFSSGPPMNTNNSYDNGNDTDNLRQLAHTLANAYGNALMHETPDTDTEAMDLRLEKTSIRFSSHMLYEISKGHCQSDEHPDGGATADRTCVLDDESIGLRGLTDMLSYAAYQLEKLERSSPQGSAPPADGTKTKRALVAARIGSLEHLYRMVVALSRIHFDQSQGGVYLAAAREQLGLARRLMENERTLCACSDRGYTAQLMELSQLDNQLYDMQNVTARP